MNIAGVLLEQMAALFLMMGLGFLLVKIRLLKSDDSHALSVITIYIIGPAVILKAFQIDFSDQVRDGFLLALGAALLIHGLLFGICWLYGRITPLRPVEKASVIYSNAGNLIVPLVMSVLGDEWVIYASAFMCVQLFFIWSHGRILISGEKGVSVKKILLNANLIAVLVGLTMLLLGWRLPTLLGNVCGQLSNTMGPVCMLMLGMMLADVNWKEILGSRRTWLVVGLKMIATPLIILFFLKLSHLPGLVENGKTILYISFMAVMTPAATTVTQLAQMYRRDGPYASAINVMTTLVCIVTMPLLTWLYDLVM
ncbi:MAG: AEC family transporter [Clostridia bacterium]|nr:AEC family transporter [Clostridia bacterium]